MSNESTEWLCFVKVDCEEAEWKLYKQHFSYSSKNNCCALSETKGANWCAL